MNFVRLVVSTDAVCVCVCVCGHACVCMRVRACVSSLSQPDGLSVVNQNPVPGGLFNLAGEEEGAGEERGEGGGEYTNCP